MRKIYITTEFEIEIPESWNDEEISEWCEKHLLNFPNGYKPYDHTDFMWDNESGVMYRQDFGGC